MHPPVDEDIAQLDISMNNIVVMQERQSITKLLDNAPDFNLVEILSPEQHFSQTLVLTQLQHDVDIVFVLKEAFEAHNILVLD